MIMSENKLQHPEVPIITIERDEEPKKDITARPSKKWQWLGRIALAAATVALLVALFAGYKIYRYYNIGIPISTTPSQNIDKLKQSVIKEKADVILSNDSVFGVAMDLYALHGLKASIEFEEPDTADQSVYLYSRCADHTAQGEYLGSLVIDGKELQSDRTRLGYMAMADGNMVIGISRSDKVKDYVMERGGSFFRQFILVSDGVKPTHFYLRGKVERRAIGRIGDTLYYIATRHKETLYDFADALLELEFTDVIYITGGSDYCFYRTADGERHDIGDIGTYPHLKWKGVIPWLVFRKQ